MADLRLRYNRTTDLSAFPKIATLIGTYTAAFGNFELALWHTYGIVVKLDEDEVMFLLARLRGFAPVWRRFRLLEEGKPLITLGPFE
jgi:hypothetical protein